MLRDFKQQSLEAELWRSVRHLFYSRFSWFLFIFQFILWGTCFILVSVDAVYAMAHALHNLVLHQVDTNRNTNKIEEEGQTDLNGLNNIEGNTHFWSLLKEKCRWRTFFRAKHLDRDVGALHDVIFPWFVQEMYNTLCSSIVAVIWAVKLLQYIALLH